MNRGLVVHWAGTCVVGLGRCDQATSNNTHAHGPHKHLTMQPTKERMKQKKNKTTKQNKQAPRVSQGSHHQTLDLGAQCNFNPRTGSGQWCLAVAATPHGSRPGAIVTCLQLYWRLQLHTQLAGWSPGDTHTSPRRTRHRRHQHLSDATNMRPNFEGETKQNKTADGMQHRMADATHCQTLREPAHLEDGTTFTRHCSITK